MVRGTWEEKYWKNVPGPVYSTRANLLSGLASSAGPQFLLNDRECEFVWRQPQTPEEIRACIRAIEFDEVGSYQVDGNKYWKPKGVRAWWTQKEVLLSWARGVLARPIHDAERYHYGHDDSVDVPLLTSYVTYFETGLPEYLRGYLFLLENGRSARVGEALPEL